MFVKKIKEEGYVIYKNYIIDTKKINNEFEEIINNTQNAFDKNTGKNKCLRSRLGSTYLNQNNFPKIYKNLFNNFVIKICKRFDIDFMKDAKDTFIHKDYENTNSNNTYPHFDYTRKLKFFLCISDMDSTNVCFKVFT